MTIVEFAIRIKNLCENHRFVCIEDTKSPKRISLVALSQNRKDQDARDLMIAIMSYALSVDAKALPIRNLGSDKTKGWYFTIGTSSVDVMVIGGDPFLSLSIPADLKG